MISQMIERKWPSIKLLIAVAIVASIYPAVGACREKLSGTTLDIDALALGFALLLCTGYRVLNAHGWTLVLRALRQEIAASACIRIWLTAEACRWLPGSIWNYGSRALQAKRSGMPAVVAAASVALEMGLTIAAWFLVAMVFLLTHARWNGDVRMTVSSEVLSVAIPLAMVALVVALLVWRLAGNWLVQRLGRTWSRVRCVADLRPGRRWSAVAFVYYLVMVLLQGLVLACLTRAFPFGQAVPVSALVGANAAAWIIGFFAFMAPGGLVVREGSLAAMLVAWLPLGDAVTLAIVWRLLQMASELLCLGGLFSLQLVMAARPGNTDPDIACDLATSADTAASP